jgi:hypothetical protein
MISGEVPFARLRALLLDPGFVEGAVEGKYLGFYPADSETVFPFRMVRPQDKVSRADLLTVRKQLDGRGLLEEDAVDAALRKASAETGGRCRLGCWPNSRKPGRTPIRDNEGPLCFQERPRCREA